MRLHHLGIACYDINDAIEGIKKYHNIISKSEIIYDSLQNASLCMVKTDANVDIEFIAGEGVVHLCKRGISFYHVCYEVDNLDETIEQYISQCALLISSPKKAILFGGRRVAFLQVDYGLIELLEA